MAPLLEGILLGLTLAILLGPAFFTLLQTALLRGFRSGAVLAAGIFLSDITLVYLSTIGAQQVIDNKGIHLYFGIIGGIVLMGIGIYTFTRKVLTSKGNEVPDVKLPGPLTYLFKGFFLNFTNPFLWIFWVSVVISVSSNYGINTPDMFVFFAGLLSTILITDLLKSYGAHLISGMLNPRVLTIINRVVGIFLVFFGILLIARIGMGY
ncbi:MAG: LysE family transporter [Bacteroidales bacterium]|nr:LysE family transporter [Bacteroidales bacterium]